jgi:O-antigen/teichoic acid export membrane protein
VLNKIKQKYKGTDLKNRRIIYNTFLSFVVTGGGAFISLLLMPAYMRFFPEQQILGLWFTALSVLSWFLTFDLGIGNGLRNNLVDAFASNDNLKVKKYISSAYIMVGVAVFTIVIVGYFVFYYINWNTVFNISETQIPANVLLYVVRIIFIGIMLQFFLRLINSVMYAMQKPVLPNLLSLISSVFLILFLLLSSKEDEITNLIKLAYANVVAANLPILIATVTLFAKKLKYSRPSLKSYDKRSASDIIKLGGVFFWVQIMYMIISNTNEFLISWTTGTANVVDFKIYNSLFGIVGTVFSLAIIPVWSEVTEAYVKNEIAWIKTLYSRLYKIGFLVAVALILLIFLLQMIVNIWLGEKAILIDKIYALVFAISGILFIWNAILSSLASGIGKLKMAVIFMTAGAILNIPMAYLFTTLTNSWIGVVMANIVSILPFCLAQTIWFEKYFNNELHINRMNK